MNYEPESLWLLGQFQKWKEVTEKSISGIGFTYVDLGCAHPVNKSLTHFVRDLGWCGVAVDANDDYSDDWGRMFGAISPHNHFYLALLSDQPSDRFVTHDNAFTSRISSSEESDHPEKWGIKCVNEMKCIPLEEVLLDRRIGKIDLLTVDLEGMEARVLATLDFEKHQPQFVVVEYVTEGVGVDCAAANMLISKGYELVQMFPSNLIFRRK